ncbi:MAG: polysaccharide pyruvyl transferase family protein [Syntrophaceae bacterium]
MNYTQKYKVGISGSYGGLNLGDEAILHCITSELRKSLPVEITVFSRNPEHTLKHHEVEKAVAVRTLSRDEVVPEISGLDLFILGGGGILFDREVRVYLREALLALDRSIPLMTYAIGAGPLNDAGNQAAVRDCLCRAAAITVRERSAKKILEDAGVDCRIDITADPALLLEPEPLGEHDLHREGLDTKPNLIGISVREPGAAAPDIDQEFYHGLLANAADYMIDRYNAHVVFIPMERKVLDMQHSHAVIARMLRPQRASVLMGNYSAGRILTLMDNFVFAVGMRLHFLIFAALRGVPFVALPYASKVSGFLDDIGLLSPPLELVNSGRLIAHIDRSWDQREEIKRQIGARLPELKSRARETNKIAVKILRGESP